MVAKVLVEQVNCERWALEEPLTQASNIMISPVVKAENSGVLVGAIHVLFPAPSPCLDPAATPCDGLPIMIESREVNQT